MYVLDKETARNKMVNEENLPTEKVDMLLKDYPPLSDEFREIVEQWLANGTIHDQFEAEGLTIPVVMDNQQVHFLVAVSKLNELLNENLSKDKKEELKKMLSEKVFFE